MCGVRPLPAPRLDELMVTAPREQGLEEQRLRRAGDESAAKFTEDRGVESGVCELQAQHVFAVDAAAHGLRRMAIRKPRCELQKRDKRQPSRRPSRLSVRGEQRSKDVIRK